MWSAVLTELDQIVARLGQPSRPHPGGWDGLAGFLGPGISRLPKGFTDFVDAYGAGMLGGDLYVVPPAPVWPWGTLLTVMERGERELRDRRASFGTGDLGVPFPIHPEPGGLIRWAVSADEDRCYFLADPARDPERWPIVWQAVGFEEQWHVFDPPFERFLLDLAGGAVGERIGWEGGPDYGTFTPHPGP